MRVIWMCGSSPRMLRIERGALCRARFLGSFFAGLLGQSQRPETGGLFEGGAPGLLVFLHGLGALARAFFFFETRFGPRSGSIVVQHCEFLCSRAGAGQIPEGMGE